MSNISLQTGNELETPFDLTEEQIDFFRENGYIKLKNVLSPASHSIYE